MKTIIRIILIACITFNINLLAGVGGNGTAGAKFLSIGVGGKAVALGDAFVAVANDASTLYWNPAGIADLEKNMVILNHVNWFAGISHDFAGASFILDNSSGFGVSMTFLTMSDQQVTTVEQPEGTDLKYGASSFALGATYAKRMTDLFSFGVTFKYIEENIWEASANNYAFDIGALYHTGYKDIVIGVTIYNLGPTMSFDGTTLETKKDPNWPLSKQDLNVSLQTQEYALPLRFSMGLSKKFTLNDESNILAVFSLNNNNDVGESVSVGTEYNWKSFGLRAGYRSGYEQTTQDMSGLSFGAGYNLYLDDTYELIIDYAYQDYGFLNSVNRFTFQFGF